jgi:integrase
MTKPRGPQGGPQNLRTFKLTERFVRRITDEIPPARETAYADQDVPRHYIRVRPPTRAGQPWPAESRIRYTLGGRRVWLSTGNPRTMSLPALRTAARAALAIVDAGGDPAAARAKASAEWTVKDLWAAYQVSPEFARCTPEVRLAIAGWFTHHILPRVGNERLTSIDVPMVRRLIRAVVTDTRTSSRGRRLGGPSAARKVGRLFSAVLSWAVGEGRLDRNPLTGALRLDGDRVRETVITDPQDYVALFGAMDRMVAEGSLRPVVRAFFIVAALTGMRRGELQSLTWRQVNLGDRRITLTDTKGGKLSKRGVKQETISIPPLAAAALAGIMPVEAMDDDRVFLPRSGRVLHVNIDWLRVRAAAGLPADLTLHGLRHSLGTAAVLGGLSGPEVQHLLRHRSPAITARYIHLAEAITQRLADRATAHLTAGLGDAPPSAEVHHLPTSRRRA